MSPRTAVLLRRAPLVLALLLGGCSADGYLRQCAECASPPEPAAAREGEAPGKVEKAPPPRTLPEALCAYWKAVHSHPCADGGGPEGKEESNGKKSDGKDSNGSDSGGSKSPPANGDSEKKDETKNG